MEFTPKFETIVDLFNTSTDRYAASDLFGVKARGHWTWLSFAEVRSQVDAFRRSLAELGVCAGDHIALISSNRVEWAVTAFAAVGLGARVVPMYETQLPKEWEFILKDCQATVLVVSTDDIYQKSKAVVEAVPSIKTVIRMDAPAAEPMRFAALVEKGRSSPMAATRPDKHDIAYLIYTSGTTGNPKGVQLSHYNIASNVSAIHEFFDMNTTDRGLSFLPWAHAFGLTVDLHGLLSMGASLALNSTVTELVAEMAEVQPTILVSVPRIFNRIHDGVHKQIAAKPKPVQKIFHSGVSIAVKRGKGQSLGMGEKITLGLADKLVFGKVRAKFGGRLRYAISGGAALSREVGEFIDALGINVFEGYGLTETSPIITANSPAHRRLGSVGTVIPGCRVTIDKQATNDANHGEIVAYGPNIMRGYYNRPEETAEVLQADGGFRTGDMGYVDDDGFLFITGRIKEQYKLENGKYVVPVPLEEGIKLSMFITSAFVHGADKPFNVALVVPDFEALRNWCSEQGMDVLEPSELVAHPKVIDKIRAEIEENSKPFKSYERIKKFLLLEEDFTTENGMLTPSMKLKRREVLGKYGASVEKLYAGA